jgi:hypothetical protein
VSTSNNESESGPGESDLARIRAEEIYRAEVQSEIASSRPTRTGLTRTGIFLKKVSARSPLTPKNETPFRVNLHAHAHAHVLAGEAAGDEHVKYRVRVIHSAGSLIEFGGT